MDKEYWSQGRVAIWQKQNKLADAPGAMNHIMEEVGELALSIQHNDPEEKIASECADIVILLYTIANAYGFDLLDAVDEKMDVNIKREWHPPDEKGIVRHVKEGEDGN